MRMKKFLIMIFLVLLITLSATIVEAASASISATSTDAKVGDTVKINVSFTAAAWNLTVSGNKISGESYASQTSDLNEATTTKSFNLDTSSAGTYTATLSGDITDEEGTTTKVNKSVTVKVSEKAVAPTPTPAPEPTPTPSTKSSDTSLKSLTVAPFGNLKSPYDITVDNSYEKVTISALPNHSGAKVSGKLGEFSLEDGTNQFKITVTAEDGTQKTYSIYIRRKVAETKEPITPPNVVDNNKKEDEKKPEEKKVEEELGLANLVLTGVELNPKFSADVYEYKAEFSEDVDTLEILATANVEGATVEVVGNSNLKIGENLITIIVKSEDGETTKTYQIMLTKNQPEISATTETDGVVVDAQKEQELKNKLGKIILIAAAAIIVVILLGIFAIAKTRKNNRMMDYESEPEEDNKKENKFRQEGTFGKNDFKVAVDEEEAYKELEKLSNIRNKENISVDTKNDNISEASVAEESETTPNNVDVESIEKVFLEKDIFSDVDGKTEISIENGTSQISEKNDIDSMLLENESVNNFSKNKKSKGRRFK